MKVLIFDPSLVPDVSYQQRVVQLFGRIVDVSVRFVTGILQASWHAHDFRPDIIVFDWICERLPLDKLIAMLRGIRPGAAMFHLDGGGVFLNASTFASSAELAVPVWLQDIASPWVLARLAVIPVMSAQDGS
jgi:hypothetical protein